ncbi:MAG: DUF3467 domain-containing protein [Candidatus Acidiferrales bacterium]
MEEGKAKRQQVRFVQPEGLPSVYTNNARVQISYNDVKIYFSEATSEPGTQMLLVPGETTQGPATMAVERVCMILSPEFARSLQMVLASTIEKYEATFGKLRPQPEGTNVPE